LAFAGGLLGAALGAVVVTYYLSRYSAEIIRAARLILLFTPAILVGYVFRANLEARANFTSANQSRVWPFVQTLVALLGLWWSHLLTPITAALALFVPLAAQSVWLGYKLASHFALSQQRLLSDMRDLLSYGLRTYGTDVFYTLSTQVDLAFIIAFLSPAALGIYTIALTAARQLNLLQFSLNMVLLPKASGLEFDAAIDLVGRMARISTLITAVGAIVALVLLPALIPLFYGSAFLAAGSITRILILETFLMSIASVFAQAFNSTGRPGIVSGFQAGWVCTSIMFLFLLVPRLGLNGAAIALTLSSLVRLVATLVSYPILLRRPVPSLIPTRADIGYLRYKFSAYTRLA
jgi:O-antigen/teichoic acid export membrane protein